MRTQQQEFNAILTALQQLGKPIRASAVGSGVQECPNHDKPIALTVALDGLDKVKVKCWRGCTSEQVKAALKDAL